MNAVDGRELLKDVLREHLNVKKRIDLSGSRGVYLGYSKRYVDLKFVGEGNKIGIPGDERSWVSYDDKIVFRHKSYGVHIIIDEKGYVQFGVSIDKGEAREACGVICFACYGWRERCIARSIVQSYLTRIRAEINKELESSCNNSSDDKSSSCDTARSPESSLDEDAENDDTDGSESDSDWSSSSEEDSRDETREDDGIDDVDEDGSEDEDGNRDEVVEPTSFTSEDVHGGPECEQDIPDSQSENPEGTDGIGSTGKDGEYDSHSPSSDQSGDGSNDRKGDSSSQGCGLGCGSDEDRGVPAGDETSGWCRDDVVDSVIERINDDGIKEHKHEGYDYWHPVSRVHAHGDSCGDSCDDSCNDTIDDVNELSAGDAGFESPEDECGVPDSGAGNIWEMLENPDTPNHSYGGGGAQARGMTANDSDRVGKRYVVMLLKRFFSSLEDIFSREDGFDKWSGKKVIRSCIVDPGELPDSKYRFANSNDMLLFVDISGSVSHLAPFIASVITAACDERNMNITVVVGSEAHPEKVLRKREYMGGVFDWNKCPVEWEHNYIHHFEKQVDVFMREWRPMVGSTIVIWSDYMDINVRDFKKLGRLFKGFNVVFLSSHDPDYDNDYSGNESFDVESFACKNGWMFLWGIDSVEGIRRAMKELSLKKIKKIMR